MTIDDKPAPQTALGEIVRQVWLTPAMDRLWTEAASDRRRFLDRVTLGFVVDFVDFYLGTWHFWAFNVADASITIGAILVFSDLLRVSRHASHPV